MFTILSITTTLTKILFSPEVREAAYLDPGSGSFILQLIIAGAAGAIFMLRGYISKFFSIFRKSDSTSEDEEDTSDDAE